jgi:hypothetical protein
MQLPNYHPLTLSPHLSPYIARFHYGRPPCDPVFSSFFAKDNQHLNCESSTEMIEGSVIGCRINDAPELCFIHSIKNKAESVKVHKETPSMRGVV